MLCWEGRRGRGGVEVVNAHARKETRPVWDDNECCAEPTPIYLGTLYIRVRPWIFYFNSNESTPYRASLALRLFMYGLFYLYFLTTQVQYYVNELCTRRHNTTYAKILQPS